MIRSQSKTASITYGEDQTDSTCKFTNLDVDAKNPKTYYVYELDDDGKPIKDSNVHTINGKEFYTSYDKNKSFKWRYGNHYKSKPYKTTTIDW